MHSWKPVSVAHYVVRRARREGARDEHIKQYLSELEEVRVRFSVGAA